MTAPTGSREGDELPEEVGNAIAAFANAVIDMYDPEVPPHDGGLRLVAERNQALRAAILRYGASRAKAAGGAEIEARVVKAAMHLYGDLASLPLDIQERVRKSAYGWLEEFREACHALACVQYRDALDASSAANTTKDSPPANREAGRESTNAIDGPSADSGGKEE